jgi:hypothetical protein
MPVPSSANAWPFSPARLPVRRRPAAKRPARYAVRREGIRLAGSFHRPERSLTRTRPEWTHLWTLYSRLEWALATARVDRVRRRARPRRR